MREAQARISDLGVTLSKPGAAVEGGLLPDGSGWQYGDGRQMRRVYGSGYRIWSIRLAQIDGTTHNYDPNGNTVRSAAPRVTTFTATPIAWRRLGRPA